MHGHSFRALRKGALKDIHVNVNGDWSGDAIVRWTENGEAREVNLPGEIIRAVALRCFASEITGAFESALDKLEASFGVESL
jgi:hypothetical protein